MKTLDLKLFLFVLACSVFFLTCKKKEEVKIVYPSVRVIDATKLSDSIFIVKSELLPFDKNEQHSSWGVSYYYYPKGIYTKVDFEHPLIPGIYFDTIKNVIPFAKYYVSSYLKPYGTGNNITFYSSKPIIKSYTSEEASSADNIVIIGKEFGSVKENLKMYLNFPNIGHYMVTIKSITDTLIIAEIPWTAYLTWDYAIPRGELKIGTVHAFNYTDDPVVVGNLSLKFDFWLQDTIGKVNGTFKVLTTHLSDWMSQGSEIGTICSEQISPIKTEDARIFINNKWVLCHMLTFQIPNIPLGKWKLQIRNKYNEEFRARGNDMFTVSP